MAEDTPTETPSEGNKEPQTIPYERFAQKVAEIKALEAKLLEATQAVDTSKAWESKHSELITSSQKEKSGWEQTEALLRIGITDDDIADLAKYRFQKSGEEDFIAWLKEKANDDPILKTYFNKEVSPKIEEQTPPKKEPIPPISPNNGARTSPPPRGDFSPESVQNMSIEDIKANYSKIASAWGYTPRKF